MQPDYAGATATVIGWEEWNRNAVKCMIFKHKLDRATFMLSSDKSFASPRQEIPRNVHQVDQVDYVDEGSHRFWMMVGAWWIFNKFLTRNFHILSRHLLHSQDICLNRYPWDFIIYRCTKLCAKTILNSV